MSSIPLAVWLALTLVSDPPAHDPGAGHHGGGQHGNPSDLDEYIAHMESPARDAWQKPDEVIRALGLKPGKVVCDIGTGPGYFALRLARVVGASGRVYAVDVEPRMLGVLRERIEKAGARNVTPVLALPDDPLLPQGACDLVLIVDTFHHFPDGAAYLKGLVRLLRPGGRVANIDFQKKETPEGPPVGHRVDRADFLKMAEAAGLALAEEKNFLPYQYFLVLAPAPSRR